MKIEKVPCRIIRYREFPELLFGESPNNGLTYFDATHFIRSRGDERRHSVQEFRIAFHHWITALSNTYSIDNGKFDVFGPREVVSADPLNIN